MSSQGRAIGAITASFLLCLIGACLFVLAVMGGRHVMCSVYAHRQAAPSYCAQAKAVR